MYSIISAPLFSGCMFVGMLICVEIGSRIGRKSTRSGKAGSDGFGAVDGAVYGLFGLLIAFTFSGAAVRFDTHRELIADEANAIGTSYLRIDLVPSAAQPLLRDEFRHYVDLRLEGYSKLPDRQAADAVFAQATDMQETIWKNAVSATQLPGAHPDAGKLLLPAINSMIDITTTRSMASALHPPPVILLLLFVLGLASSFMFGLNMVEVNRVRYLQILGYAAITALTIFIIVDMEYPRAGLIRASAYDQVLVSTRKSMH